MSNQIVMQHKNRLTLREAATLADLAENGDRASSLREAVAKLRRCIEASHANAKEKGYLIRNTRGQRAARKPVLRLTGGGEA